MLPIVIVLHAVQRARACACACAGAGGCMSAASTRDGATACDGKAAVRAQLQGGVLILALLVLVLVLEAAAPATRLAVCSGKAVLAVNDLQLLDQAPHCSRVACAPGPAGERLACGYVRQHHAAGAVRAITDAGSALSTVALLQCGERAVRAAISGAVISAAVAIISITAA